MTEQNTSGDAAARASGVFAERYDNFIGGEWVAPRGGEYFENLSPVDGARLNEIARSREADVERALDAAHKAKDAWGRTSPADRARVLNRVADAMEANLELLAKAEAKPEFVRKLEARSRQLAAAFAPELEAEAWRALLDELLFEG